MQATLLGKLLISLILSQGLFSPSLAYPPDAAPCETSESKQESKTEESPLLNAISAMDLTQSSIPDPHKMSLIQKLGGSTGAVLVQDPSGKKYVKKYGSLNSEGEHIQSEYTANRALRFLGVPVPPSQLYDEGSLPVLNHLSRVPNSRFFTLARFVQGESLGDFLKKFPIDTARGLAVKKELQKHFVAHCLLGNYDLIGAQFDNVLVDSNDHPYFIYNGSSLKFSAQGVKKPKSFFADEVTELDYLLGKPNSITVIPKKQPPLANAEAVFKGITQAEITEQIDAILKKKEELLRYFPKELRPKMEKRIDSLNKYR